MYRQGLRYRVDMRLPGMRRRADVAFVGLKIAIFVDGCFWHACPVHGTWPKANAPWWKNKILNNVRRDRDTDAHLQASGWLVLRFWEHEDMLKAATRVVAEVQRRRDANTTTTIGRTRIQIRDRHSVGRKPTS